MREVAGIPDSATVEDLHQLIWHLADRLRDWIIDQSTGGRVPAHAELIQRAWGDVKP